MTKIIKTVFGAAAAVTSKDFTQVALCLMDADGNIIENKKIDTLYGEE